MKTPIQQLEPQCWEMTEFGLRFDYEKYAKLIVKECATIFWLHGSRPEVRSAVLKHFGIDK
jgi:hypothetical protein